MGDEKARSNWGKRVRTFASLCERTVVPLQGNNVSRVEECAEVVVRGASKKVQPAKRDRGVKLAF